MDKTFETKDIITATFLKIRGHYCIGTVPAGNKYKPHERLWLFEETERLVDDLDELQTSNPAVPIREVFYCSSILKNLLNDKDEL
jgi:hypothetical protein